MIDADNALSLRALSRTGAPAAAVAVVGREGLIHLECAGRRRIDRPDPVTADDLWHIGSNGKAMTAALYARLVEAGQAAWGARLPEMFPGLALDPAWAAVTIEDLLAHRTGLSDRRIFAPGWAKGAHEDPRAARVQRAALAQAVLGAPPADPRRRFAYANINYVLAGAAIEQLTGLSWEQAMVERLFAPLGLSSAGFGAPQGDQPWGHLKPPFRPLSPVDPTTPRADNPAALGPAGRVHLSLAHHARFVRLFLTEGDGVLAADSVARLTTPPVAGGFPPYALGWAVLPGRPRSRGAVLAHEGSNTLWASTVFASPSRGVAVIAVANAFARGAAAARRLARALMKRFDPP